MDRSKTILWAAFLSLAAICASLTWLSRDFALGSDGRQRPILAMLTLLSLGFAAHLAGVFSAIRLPNSKQLGWTLFGSAALLRFLLVFSNPIQEVDLYRYLWDGGVTAQGISPYRYSPEAAISDVPTDQDQRTIERWLEKRPGMKEVHSHVHFAELSTVYPPVSQVFFTMAYGAVPSTGTITAYVRSMKTMIVLFDLGTMLIVIWLLQASGRHVGWSLLYGWSPLALKEFANSGHLDSITVFFSILAIYLLGRARESQNWPMAIGSGIALGLAIGAKLYPVILVPIFVVYWFRHLGFTKMAGSKLALGLVTVVALAPMLWQRLAKPPANDVAATQPADPATPNAPTALGQSDSKAEQNSLSGLKAFLGRWEMNDLIFMVVEENIRPEGSNQSQPPLWFALTPNSFRTSVSERLENLLGVESHQAPFLGTRLITAAIFGLVVLWCCYQVFRAPDRLNEMAFMTLAWFWFLAPTQNPWYWAWALPLLPFARNRAWIAVGGVALLYYLRFWFLYHQPNFSFAGSKYVGENIFHFFIVWIEHAPFLIALAGTNLFLWWRNANPVDPLPRGTEDLQKH